MKKDKNQFFISTRQKIFLLMAFLMVIITAALTIFFITNLGINISKSLKMPENKIQKVEFDIEGLKNLNLIK